MSEAKANTVKEFLTKMKLKFSYEEERKTFSLPYQIDGKNFTIQIFIGEKWIVMGTLLVKREELPLNLDVQELYTRLLQDTFYFNEVTYGLTKNRDIIVHAETHVDALNFEGFRTEFGSVVFGIKHFVENIMKDFPVKPSEASKLYA